MTDKTDDTRAIRRGRAIANRLLKPPTPVPDLSKEPPVRDLLLAIGDSWFNYWPRGDILDVLEARLGHTIARSAKAGRKLAEMLYAEPPSLLGTGPKSTLPNGAEITWLIGRLSDMKADEQKRLLAILVSAGGNDIAGDPAVLHSLVQKKGKGPPALNEAQVVQVVDGRLREHYATLLACITHTCDEVLGRRVSILLHGYDYPVSDGRGVPGRNWLAPVLRELGYGEWGGRKLSDAELEERKTIMTQLIDRLNKMQIALIDDNKEFSHVHHVELRGTLKSDKDYQLDWQNELHPTIPKGFGAVSAKFIDELEKLKPAAPAAAPAPNATASTWTQTPTSPAPAGPSQQQAALDPA